MVNSINQRVIKCFSKASSNQENDLSVDVAGIVEHLLLFDTVIIDRTRLQEIPSLIRVFSFEGMRELFKSNSLKFRSDLIQIVNLNEAGLKPLNQFNPTVIELTGLKEIIHDDLKIVESITQLKAKQRIKFKGLIAENILTHPMEMRESNQFFEEYKRDLFNNEYGLKIAFQKALAIIKHKSLDINQLKIKFHHIDTNNFIIVTNLKELCSINELEEHKVMESAILGIGARNSKIFDMKLFKAITGFRDDEVDLFESKLSFLSSQFEPETPSKNLRRVLEIVDFPSFQNIILEEKIDIDKFLKVRESDDCKEFRNWLWSLDNASDEEIKNSIYDFREKIGEFIRTPLGKTIRLLVGTGSGFIPVAGTAISGGIGIIDSFIIEKLLPVKGPLVFLDKQLPTIFKQD